MPNGKHEQSEQRAAERRVLIRGGRVFLGVEHPSERLSIWVRDGEIAEICPPDDAREQRAAADGTLVIDAEGGAVLPGLIDAHAHVGLLSLDRQLRIPPASQAAMIFRNLSSALDQGFTTLRDLGGVDGGLTEAIESGLVEGPRLLPSGAIMSQTAGHGDVRPRFSSASENEETGSGLVRPFALCDGVEQVTRTAREQFRAGATQLKVHATGGQLSEGDPLDSPQFSLAELQAFVEVAEDRDSYVTAHCHTVRGIRRAVEAGVRCIEHGTVMDRETAELLREQGVYVVPTLTISEVLRRFPDEWGMTEQMLAEAEWLDAAELESVRLLAEVGVEMGSGSDLIGPAQDTRAWEIGLKARLLGAAAAIDSATRVNARIMGIDDRVGTIEQGKVADLVVYRGCDPVADPELFMSRRPDCVLLSGEAVRPG